MTLKNELTHKTIGKRQVSYNIVPALLSIFSSSLCPLQLFPLLFHLILSFFFMGYLLFFPQTQFLICKYSCLRMCSIHFLFLLLILFNSFRILFTRILTSASVNLFVCFALSIFLQTHISNTSILQHPSHFRYLIRSLTAFYIKVFTTGFFTQF